MEIQSKIYQIKYYPCYAKVNDPQYYNFSTFSFFNFPTPNSQNREFTSFSVIEADTLMIFMKVIANMIANAKLEKFSNRNQSVCGIIVNA